MKFVYFTHSLQSCWNHGNAHFLRGLGRALLQLGHEIAFFEPEDSWSRRNLVTERSTASGAAFAAAFPDLALRSHFIGADIDVMLADAEVVIVHEWTDPALVRAIGQRRAAGGRFTLLFHDTHHRMASSPEEMASYDLSAFDGVLAFGNSLSAAYQRGGWGNRVFTWHEAADISHFRPLPAEGARAGAVWIGNWGDGERSEELHSYLLQPAAEQGLSLDIFGVRYPSEALIALRQYGAHYHGWAANAAVPKLFANHRFTVHVPRRFYTTHLPGIPTIRVFEALACGIPLLSAPWHDEEALFRVGDDFLMARSPADMTRLMGMLEADAALRQHLSEHGLQTIYQRHTCNHRAQELLSIIAQLRGRARKEAA